MLSAILLFGCCLVLVESAPPIKPEIKSLIQNDELKQIRERSLQEKPALLLGPQQQQSQIEFQPAFRLQQSLVQPLVPLGRIQGPNEQTMFLFHPNAPLAPLESSSSPLLKQGNPGQIFFDQFWGFIQMLPGQGSQDPPSGGSSDTSSDSVKPQSSGKLEFESDAEEIPKRPLIPQTPASTYPLPSGYPNNFIYYTISGSPQYFGNFDYIKNAQQPFFRWPEVDPSKSVRVLEPAKEDVKVQPISPVDPIETPLRSGLPEKPEDNQSKPGEAAKLFQQFLMQQKILQPQPILIRPEYFENSQQLKSVKAEEAVVPQQQAVEEPASVAQSKPVGVSITGSGGLSRSAPVSNAIVGNSGVAVSSPEATSIAGEFKDVGGAEVKTGGVGVGSNVNN